MYEEIRELAHKYGGRVVEWRRRIHRQPELSRQEERTSALAAEVLSGLGLEVRGHKSPHWTGSRNSPATFGHFGQSGSFVWADRDLGASAAFVGAEPFGPWHHDNWSVLNSQLLSLARERA